MCCTVKLGSNLLWIRPPYLCCQTLVNFCCKSAHLTCIVKLWIIFAVNQPILCTCATLSNSDQICCESGHITCVVKLFKPIFAVNFSGYNTPHGNMVYKIKKALGHKIFVVVAVNHPTLYCTGLPLVRLLPRPSLHHTGWAACLSGQQTNKLNKIPFN